MRHSIHHLLVLFSCLMLATTSVTSAQDETPDTPAEEQKAPYDSLKDRVSYTIGQNLASQIKFDDELDLNMEVVIEGFSDLLNDKKAKLSERQKQEAILEFNRQIREAQVEKLKKQYAERIQSEEAFLDENAAREGVKTTKSGLQYEVLKEGEGDTNPKPTDIVLAHYHGTLIDGTVFDSSVNRGEPIEFEVGRVIDGWQEALQLMTVGDKYKLYVPYDLAYNEKGPGDVIKPFSTLIFEVELIDIKGSNE